MKTHRLLTAAACIAALYVPRAAAAPSVPPDGLPVLAVGALENFQITGKVPEEGRLEKISVAGQSFTRAWRVQTIRQPAETWKLQLTTRTDAPVKRGDVLWIRFFLRSPESLNETGEGHTTFVFETTDSEHAKSIDLTVGAGPAWREFVYPFVCRHDLPAGGGQLSFRFGFRPQLVELGGVELLNYRRTRTVEQLPIARIGYDGRAADATWRAAASERIERLRKADLRVTVRDAAGQPVSGARIEATLQRHAFGFGSAVVGDLLTGQGPDSERYRQTVEQNFSKVVFENELKWPAWEERAGAKRESTMAAIRWLEERGIALRGHVLLWPSWGHVGKDCRNLREDPAALRKRIADRISEVMGATRGHFADWDVINEPYAHNDLMKALGDEAMIEWFKLARAVDPRPVLFLNDYAGLAAGGMNTKHKDHFEKTARFLKDGGAPIGGLGLQCHFGWSVTPPDAALAELDRWGRLGLTVHLTEFDIDILDEQLQADYTRDLLTVAFSHPAVSSVTTWGFWEGRHWRPDAALWRKDWSIKPNGQAWLDLTRKQWWTRASGTTDSAGVFSTRGFKGAYQIAVSKGGQTSTVAAALGDTACTIDVKLDSAPSP